MTPPPSRPCRLCGYPFVPEYEGQLHCNEDCESRDRKIDEAEQRREERCDDCCALPSFCECNNALNYEAEEEL